MKFTDASCRLIAALAFGACLVVAPYASAATVPPTGKVDARVRVVTYNPDDVVTLHGYVGYQIHLQFAEGEEFVNLGSGDNAAFDVGAERNHFFIKPKEARASTNLTVLTNRRAYHFDYTVSAAAPESTSPSGRSGPRARTARNGARAPVVGVLVAAAAAPYRFDPDQRMSFYVTVRTEVGDRMVWGTDLERALAESASQPRIGASVALSHQGTTAVDVRVPERNEAGDLVGEKKIVAQRARWRIETVDHMRSLQQTSDLFRNDQEMSPTSLQAQPNLAAASAGAKLAEQYAQRVTADGPSQQRLVRAIRDRLAEALAQGRDIHLPASRPTQAPPHVRQRAGRGREEPIHERF